MANSEDRQHEIELAMARGESILLDGDENLITDSPVAPVEEEVKPVVHVKEEADPEIVTPRSSLKYIPIDKYKDEKNEWKQTQERLETQVKDLQSKYDEAAEEGKKFSGFEMKEYFQKYNIPESQQPAVTEMLNLAAKQHKIPDEVTSQISTMQSKIAEFEDKNRFDGEWKTFASDITKSYPNATYSQLEAAKQAMDILAHHEDKYLDKEFDYIAFREKPIFDEIFAQPVRKGFESRSQNADTYHEQPKGKMDIETMSPQQIAEREQQIEEETRLWDSQPRFNSDGGRMI